MKESGKQAVEVFSSTNFTDFNFSAASEIPCRKHPNSSSVGICAYCLKDRLVKLVCSECGEQRLSSCSCSDASSSYRNSCSTMEVGSVGRVSFLIENDKIDPQQIFNTNPSTRSKKGEEDKKSSEQVIFLRRSTSSCVEVKKSNGFWRIKRLFKKKSCEKNGEFSDEKSEIWVSDVMGTVSRSRSLCSLRGYGKSDFDDGNKSAFSSSGVFLDPNRKSGVDLRGLKRFGGQNVIELDRVIPNRSVFPARENDFNGMEDESAFIDLKVELSSESLSCKEEFSGARMSCGSDHGGGYRKIDERFEFGGSFANLKSGGGVMGNGGSCRIAVNERGMKRGGKSHSKVWKWIFKYHHPAANKKEEK